MEAIRGNSVLRVGFWKPCFPACTCALWPLEGDKRQPRSGPTWEWRTRYWSNSGELQLWRGNVGGRLNGNIDAHRDIGTERCVHSETQRIIMAPSEVYWGQIFTYRNHNWAAGCVALQGTHLIPFIQMTYSSGSDHTIEPRTSLKRKKWTDAVPFSACQHQEHFSLTSPVFYLLI